MPSDELYSFNSTEFADKVAELCYKHYESLGKTGKPIVGKEWTLLSAIVSVSENRVMNVVALATGSKCIGRHSMSSDGCVVNDSHAEVLARRCFLRYLYHEIQSIQLGKTSDVLYKFDQPDSELKMDDEFGLYKVKPDISFHFFTSHIPCGDASIIPKTLEDMTDDSERIVKSCDKRKLSDIMNDVEPKSKRIKMNDVLTSECVGDVVKSCDTIDVYRTGAKCLPNDPRQDSKSDGAAYHVVGAVRTKPGRGDPTLSVSCSDKIARWIAVGIQGALLSLFIPEPIRLSSVIIGGGGPFSFEALHRAIVSRTKTDHPPHILRTNRIFEMSRYSATNHGADRPCSSAMIWVPHRPLQVAVLGIRQGTTKKSKHKGSLMVSKRELFKLFVTLTIKKYLNMTYECVKQLSKDYKDQWSVVRKNLGVWTVKPKSLNYFFITESELFS